MSSAQKEELVLSFLRAKKGGAFLEIGIGSVPKIPRLKAMQEGGIKYVGADFASVIQEHESRIRKGGLGSSLEDGTIKFWGNDRGTYNYNLLKMLRAGLKFDLIYLDGHHTLQTDLPAAILASAMLKDDGLLALDDIHWTLSKIAKLMHENFDLWLFYKDAYDFDRYEPEEIRDKAMHAITFEILIPHLGFELVESLSTPGWAVLKKKPVAKSV
jgi:hypothetical protein